MKLLYFSAVWCGPCRRVAPVFQKLQEELENFEMEKIDVDEKSELAQAMNVMSLPTFILLNDEGKEVARAVGTRTEAELREFAALRLHDDH